MTHATTEPFGFPAVNPAVADPLTDVLRQGARQMLIKAVEAEVAAWIDDHAHLLDADNHRQVVRNGHADPRTIVTGVGPLQVRMPRVHDRRNGDERERFTSKILPPYLRKAKAIDELIPWLYLKGISYFRGRRLRRRVTSLARAGLPRPVSLDNHAAARTMARRLPGVVATRFVGQTIRVRVGGRDSFQHSFARGSPVYSRDNGRDSRWPQGVDCRA